MSTEGPTPATQIADLRRTLDSVFAEREKARAALAAAEQRAERAEWGRRGLMVNLDQVGPEDTGILREIGLPDLADFIEDVRRALAPTGDRAEPATDAITLDEDDHGNDDLNLPHTY